MGLDYGTRTVGVAISDELFLTARALEIIRRKDAAKLRRTYARIEALIALYDVTELVVGLPLHMDMTESEMSTQARAFGERLSARTRLPVAYTDERLTSAEARKLLRLNDIPASEEKAYIDMAAAKVILESYLSERVAPADAGPAGRALPAPGEASG